MATWRETIKTGVSPQAVLQYAEDESAASFLNDEAVFIRNWPYMYALAGTSDYPKLEPEQLGIAPIPVDKPGNPSYSTLGGWNFLINATSESPDEAWEFIEWMTAPEQLVTNAELGSKLPTRETLYDDPAVLKKVPVAKLGKDAIIKNSTPRPISPYYSDVSWNSPRSSTRASRATSPPRMPRRRCRRTSRRSSTRANKQPAKAGCRTALRRLVSTLSTLSRSAFQPFG